MPQLSSPPPSALPRAILACVLLALPACARMVETRTDTIVSREPGRKIEAWHPERDQLDVSVNKRDIHRPRQTDRFRPIPRRLRWTIPMPRDVY